MVYLIGLIVISPLWGMLSTQLFLQSWLSFINFGICLIGFIRGKTARRDNLIGIGVCLLSMALFSAGLWLGQWILAEQSPFGQTQSENVVYWVFCAISALFMVPQMLKRVGKSWKQATVPGERESDYLRNRAKMAQNDAGR